MDLLRQSRGSPLRNHRMNFASSPSLRPIGSRPVSGEVSPFAQAPDAVINVHISQQLNNMSLHPALHDIRPPWALSIA